MATAEAAPPRARFLPAPGAPPPATAERDGCRVALEGRLFDGGDAQSVLEAYLRDGAGALERLSGVFALVVDDGRDGSVLCVRDPLGVYPLFHASRGRELLLSTSVDALLAEDGISSDLNVAALADHLSNRWPDPAETYFAAVRRVPPGHVFDGTTARRYWNPAPPGEGVRWVEADEVDRFDELMAQAVRRALALGPSGMFLSGGLDSVSVAAVAVDEARAAEAPPPLGLSIVFPTAEANEEAVQRGVAAGLGLEHVLLPFDEAVGPRGVLAAALETSAAWPAPLANIWYPAYRSLTELAADRGVKVILTGGGGDEWLGVTPFLAADLMRKGDVAGLYRLWSTMHRSYRLSRLATLRSVLWTFGARPLAAATAARHAPGALRRYRRRRQERVTPPWVAPSAELRRTLLDRAEAAFDPRAEQGFYLREGQLSLDHALISMEMEELHESGRRTGVPVRMPFWDADLVDFLYRTPPELLTEGGRAKGLVRKMLDRRFPELGFEKHKKVLAVNFFAQIVYGEGPRLWRELGGATALAGAGVVDPSRLNSLVGDVFEGKRPQDVSLVWNLLSVEAWVRSRLRLSGEVKT